MGRKKRSVKKLIQNIAITDIADKGKALGRTEDGMVIFVENAVPGDIVDIMVFKSKKGYAEGRVERFHSYSKNRVEAFCQHFGICGGCKWQHLDYNTQLLHKANTVSNAMQRIAKVPIGEQLPILPCLDQQYYRNKVEFAFSNKKWLTRAEVEAGENNQEDVLGFHRSGAFDKIVAIDECYLQQAPSNELRNALKSIAIDQGLEFYDIKSGTGFLRNVIIRISSLGEIMIILSFFKEDLTKRTTYLDAIANRFPQLKALLYCINSKDNDIILDLDIHCHFGQEFIEEKLGDVRFRIGPKSFFQTNTKQAVRLFDTIVRFAELEGTENVYDLYTGIGSIGLYLARHCRQVVGIEEVAPAIKDAKANAEFNGFNNTVFYAGDVKDILSSDFADKHERPDLVITDPPRAGMHAEVIKILLLLEAPKIIYVSCNPATQARDFQLLDQKYEVLKLQPVDMFPHTHHIETVALLKLKPKTSINNWNNWVNQAF